MQFSALLFSLAAIFLASKTLAQEPTPQVNLYSFPFPLLFLLFLSLKTFHPHPYTTRLIYTPSVSYSDTSCANYIGHEYPTDGNVTGGPAGSKAIIWVNGGPPDNPCCGCRSPILPNPTFSVVL